MRVDTCWQKVYVDLRVNAVADSNAPRDSIERTKSTESFFLHPIVATTETNTHVCNFQTCQHTVSLIQTFRGPFLLFVQSHKKLVMFDTNTIACAHPQTMLCPSKDNKTPYQPKTRIETRIVRLRLIAMMMVWCFACLLQVATSYQLSMVASRAPFTDRRLSSSSQQRSSVWGIPSPPIAPMVPGADQLSSTLISSLAEVALKARLADQSAVYVDVTANPTDLIFQGKVGPVTVQGRGWKSKLGLTCRAIEASVDSCLLDVGRILSQRKLRLITPGKHNVADAPVLTANDQADS